MQELLRNMQEKRDSAYRVYREAEITENEAVLSHADGVLDGIDMMIELVKERMEE